MDLIILLLIQVPLVVIVQIHLRHIHRVNLDIWQTCVVLNRILKLILVSEKAPVRELILRKEKLILG